MNQFDKEIKNKINSKTYDYQPSAWRAFKHHSGMSLLSTGAKLGIGGGIAAAITGGVLFFTLPSNDKPVANTIAIEQNEQNDDININTNSDTINAETDNTKAVTPTAPLTINEDSPKAIQTPVRPQDQPPIQTQSKAQPPIQTQSKAQPQPVYNIRPLEILVDTISSMDFPDYETKPADIIP